MVYVVLNMLEIVIAAAVFVFIKFGRDIIENCVLLKPMRMAKMIVA